MSWEQWSSKTVFIAGASSDIGFAIARALSDLGAHLLLHAHSERGEDMLTQSFSGTGAKVLRVDFANIDQLESHLGPLFKENPIDALVNCVGVRSRRPLKLLKNSHVQEVFSLNYFSFIEMLRIATSKGHFRPGLSVVQISSIAAHSGGAGVTAYAASKAAVDNSVRSLAKELAPKGIRLNSVVCGQTNGREYQSLHFPDGDPVLQRQYLGLNEPSEVADIVLFLLSPASRKISGHFLPADGGYLQ